MVKQERARVNINILETSELKFRTGMAEFNSDDHYIYYCRQESLRRNGLALIVNKRVQVLQYLGAVTRTTVFSVHFQGNHSISQ